MKVEKAEYLEEKEEIEEKDKQSSLEMLVSMFRNSYSLLCDIEITGLKVKMTNEEGSSKNFYLKGEEMKHLLGEEMKVWREPSAARSGSQFYLQGGGSLGVLGGGLVGTWLGSWVEGGVGMGGRGFAQREKCSYFVHICSYLFRFVHIWSFLFIFCSYLFIFVLPELWPNDLKSCSDFVHICSYLFMSEPPFPSPPLPTNPTTTTPTFINNNNNNSGVGMWRLKMEKHIGKDLCWQRTSRREEEGADKEQAQGEEQE